MKRLFLVKLLSLICIIACLFSITSCKDEGEEPAPQIQFDDRPWLASGNPNPYYYGYPYEAYCVFEHSVFKYYDDWYKDATDSGPASSDYISFTLYYGWDSSCSQEYISEIFGTDSIPSTSIYFRKDGKLYRGITVNEEFLSDEFKYYSTLGSIVSFNHHEHLRIPHSLYADFEEGQIDVCLFYETDEGNELLMDMSIYFERHGDEWWFANSKSYFPQG